VSCSARAGWFTGILSASKLWKSSLDFGADGEIKARSGKEGFNPQPCEGHRVQAAPLRRRARKRHIDATGDEFPVRLGGVQARRGAPRSALYLPFGSVDILAGKRAACPRAATPRI